MAYVTIPKDLDRIKNKVAFGLTLRQIVCLAVGGMIGVPIYFMTREHIGTSNATICMVVVMLPAFFLALYEKDGMPLERVLSNWIRTRYLRPRERRYQRKNKRSKQRNMCQEKPKTKAYHKNQGKKGDSKIKSVSFEPKDDSVIVKDKGGKVDVYDPFDEDHIISEINKSIAANHPEDERTVVQEQLYEYEFNPSGNSGKYVYRGVPSFLQKPNAKLTEPELRDLPGNDGIDDSLESEKEIKQEDYLDRLLSGLDCAI